MTVQAVTNATEFPLLALHWTGERILRCGGSGIRWILCCRSIYGDQFERDCVQRRVILSWNGSAGADSYIVKRSTTSGSGYVTIASGVNWPSYLDTGLVNGTTYYYVVAATNVYGVSPDSAEASATPVVVVSVPPPWQTQDIGAVGVVGGSLYSNGVFAVSGAGGDIQGTADAFRFDYMTVTGDCTIIARVASVQNVWIRSRKPG